MNTISVKSRQTGAAIIEFALIAAIFFTLLIGIMEMGRILFYMNTVSEMTRTGARVAAVCDLNDNAFSQKMNALYPQLFTVGHLTPNVAYSPSGCTVDTCSEVTVWVTSTAPVATYIPFVPLNLSLPEFRTTLPRESLRSEVGGVSNPVCE